MFLKPMRLRAPRTVLSWARRSSGQVVDVPSQPRAMLPQEGDPVVPGVGVEVGMEARGDRDSEGPGGLDRREPEGALGRHVHQVRPVGASRRASTCRPPEGPAAGGGSPGWDARHRDLAVVGSWAFDLGRSLLHGLYTATECPRRPSSPAMTPKVIATPLISGGKVSVTIASFTGCVVYASQCARCACRTCAVQVTTLRNRR
jgi:hypothetical protein